MFGLRLGTNKPTDCRSLASWQIFTAINLTHHVHCQCSFKISAQQLWVVNCHLCRAFCIDAQQWTETWHSNRKVEAECLSLETCIVRKLPCLGNYLNMDVESGVGLKIWIDCGAITAKVTVVFLCVVFAAAQAMVFVVLRSSIIMFRYCVFSKYALHHTVCCTMQNKPNGSDPSVSHCNFSAWLYYMAVWKYTSDYETSFLLVRSYLQCWAGKFPTHTYRVLVCCYPHCFSELCMKLAQQTGSMAWTNSSMHVCHGICSYDVTHWEDIIHAFSSSPSVVSCCVWTLGSLKGRQRLLIVKQLLPQEEQTHASVECW